MYNKIVVTGGAGMVGKAVVSELARLGLAREIVVLDNLSRVGASMPDGDEIIWFNADVGDEKARQLYEGADAVINLAASVGGYLFNGSNAYSQYTDNVAAQLMPIKHALEMGVGRFFQMSSACIYPVSPHKRDSMVKEVGRGRLDIVPMVPGIPGIPDVGYSSAKAMGEVALRYSDQMFGATFDDYLILRPDNIGGRFDYGDDRGHVIPVLIRRMRDAIQRGEKEVVINNPHSRRSFVHADDVAAAIGLWLSGDGLKGDDATERDKRARVHRIYNIGTGTPLSILSVAQMLAGGLFQGIKIVPGEQSPQSFNRAVDPKRIKRSGWVPHYATSRDIVRAYWGYYRANEILNI